MNFLLALLLSTPAAALTPAQVKGVFCPFHEKRAAKQFDHDYQEHGALLEIRRALQEYTKQEGKCLGVRATEEDSFELDFKGLSVPLDLKVGADGKIKAAFFGPPLYKNDSLEKVLADLKREPFVSSFFAGTADGKELFARDADKPLSISRANQIFVARAVRESKLKLSDLVTLDGPLLVRTFGQLHTWKIGTLLTVDTLLNFLIGEKDLTASDLLLSRLDRGKFRQFGKSLEPFPSFREYFQLALLPKNELKEIGKLLPSLGAKPEPAEYRMDRLDLVGTLGWFASAREICASALLVKDDILERNARLNEEYQSVQPKEIERFGIVQSRDPGISQVTAVFKTKTGPWTCLALTANHKDEIEENSFSSIQLRLMNLLVAKEKK